MTWVQLLSAAIGLALWTSVACAGEAAVVLRANHQASLPTVYSRIEWQIEPGRTYSNPFDPDEVTIDVTFTGPGGQKVVLPAFWSQQFENNSFGFNEKKATAIRQGQWLVRFCPTTEGRWTLQAIVHDHDGERRSEQASVEVAAAARGGFVRRASGNPRYFQLDSGQPFFPIGLNIAWGGDKGIDAYGDWFKRFSHAGGNFARVWMCHPNRMTETKDVGIGRIDLAACAYYDALLDLAEQNGIYCMLTFGNYRDLRDRDNWGECIWPQYPYNAAVGGPATRPVDFFNDARARTCYKNRLRYTIARYSSYTNIAFWELWNEQDLTSIDVPISWTREMAGYLKQNDPYKHLVTTSYSSKSQPDVWKLPEIDLVQVHYYGDADHIADFTSVINSAVRENEKFDKPFTISELGISAYAMDTKYDESGAGTLLHDGLWAAMMSGAAGSSWHWWWDNYVSPKDVWPQYRAAAMFSAQIDWPRRRFEPMVMPPPRRTSTEAETFEDLTLVCTGGWARMAPAQPVTVAPNGQISAELPRFLCGPAKPDLHRPIQLAVDLPQATTMTVRIVQVSDFADLRISIDGEPVADFPFSALPGMPDQEGSRQRLATGIQQVMVNKDRQVQVPAGKHTITFENIAGDWVTLGKITFANAKSSRFVDLVAVGLADESAGEHIVWLHDARSNWKNDRDGVKPRELEDVELTIPIGDSTPAKLAIEWWDTRSGEVVRRQVVEANTAQVTLAAPRFSRDIALRSTRGAEIRK